MEPHKRIEIRFVESASESFGQKRRQLLNNRLPVVVGSRREDLLIDALADQMVLSQQCNIDSTHRISLRCLDDGGNIGGDVPGLGHRESGHSVRLIAGDDFLIKRVDLRRGFVIGAEMPILQSVDRGEADAQTLCHIGLRQPERPAGFPLPSPQVLPRRRIRPSGTSESAIRWFRRWRCYYFVPITVRKVSVSPLPSFPVSVARVRLDLAVYAGFPCGFAQRRTFTPGT